MSSRAALLDACFAVRKFSYIPDEEFVDNQFRPTDVWDSEKDIEKRGGGDCDDFAISSRSALISAVCSSCASREDRR